jgi:hypothetical protein
MSGTSTEQNGAEHGCLPLESLASPQAEPGSNWARLTTAGSGRKLSACLRKQNRIAAFSRILLESSIWTSTEYFLKWSGSATRFNRSIFRLVPSTPRNSDTESGLLAAWGTPRVSRGQYMSGDNEKKLLTLEGQLATWPTPDASTAGKTSRSGERKGEMLIGGIVRTTWPTPQARDVKGQTQNADRMDAVPNIILATWPTPNASDGSGGPQPVEKRKAGGHAQKLDDYLGPATCGRLAGMESFVERLMNLSMWLQGYTAAYFQRWATASSRKYPRSSSNVCSKRKGK